METGLTRSVGLCRCCLDFTITKNLWLEYKWKNTVEVYADMIKECYNITPWSNFDNAEDERICELCVGKLRVSLEFKQQVLQCYEKLLNHPAQDEMLKRKSVESNTDESLDVPDNEIREVVDEEYDVQNFIGEYELLDNNEADEVKDAATIENPLPPSSKAKYQNVRLKKEPTVRKATRKRPAVRPQKKPQTFPKPPMSLQTIHTNKGNQCQILDNSTIIPFKTRHGFFNCFYCSEASIVHAELKNHYETSHMNVRNTQYATDNLFYWPKDKIYADITNIHCKICMKKANSIAELITHLTDIHDKKFNHSLDIKPENSILGFIFQNEKSQCSLCNKEFDLMRDVLKHMNDHYSDYICDVCGKSFFIYNRLRHHQRLHLEIHKQCKVCGLEFKSVLKFKEHVKSVHRKFTYSCVKCRITFPSKRLQTQHLTEVHKRAMPIYKCGMCEREFQSKEGLRLHKKKSRCD